MDSNQLANIQLRPATAEDAAEIADLYLTARKTLLPYAPLAHSDNGVRNWIKTMLIPSGGVDIAVSDSKIIGMCAISHDGQHSWIDQLYLHLDFVRKGVGTILLKNALAKLNRPIRLHTFQENDSARRFYEQFGFVAIQFGDGSSNEEGAPDVLYELN